MFFFYFNTNDIIDYPQNYDIDLFFYDDEKLIHIASGGLAFEENFINLNSKINIRKIIRLRRRFEIRQNDNLERDNLITIEDYFHFFNLMASRGFYSYDKVNIDDPFCYKFQLISHPIYNRKIILNNTTINENIPNSKLWQYNLSAIKKINKTMPTNFKIFNLQEYI